MVDTSRSIWKKVSRNRVFSFLLVYFLFFALALLFRLPHLLSRNSFFDGDEAIVGIMAQDFLAGRNTPLYFYGQNYGFSFFEVLTTAFWIKILGSGIWALRLGGITLFALATTFLYSGFRARNFSKKIALLTCMVVLAFPTWMLWGMMVRGGYVTSFSAICFLFYLRGKQRFTFVHLILLGFSLAVAFEAQSLILLPVLPLLLRDWFQLNGNWRNLFLGMGIAVLWILLLNFMDQNLAVWGSPGMDLKFELFGERYTSYWRGMQNGFTNFFFFHVDYIAPAWWRYLSIVAIFLLPIGVLILFIYNSKRDRLYLLFWLVLMVFLFLILGVFIGYSPRYLIAFFSGFLFLFVFFLREVIGYKLLTFNMIVVSLISFIGIGVGSKMIRDFYELDLNYMQSLEELHRGVVQENKKAVFACDNFLNWQWNYLYGEDIPSTAFRNEDRISRFAREVDSLYQFNPKSIAIIGFEGAPLDMNKLEGFSKTDYKIGSRYFIQPVVMSEYHDLGYDRMGKRYEALKFVQK